MVRWPGDAALATIAVVLIACGSGTGTERAGEPEVEAVERVEGPSAEMVAADDVLVAAPSPDREPVDGTTEALHRSDDGGRTWEAFGLPEAPEELTIDLGTPTLAGDVVVVTGRQDEESGGGAYVWTSPDGRDWRGGALVDEGVRPYAIAEVRAAGDVLVAGVAVGGDGATQPSTYELYRSDDQGTSWEAAAVDGDLTFPPGEGLSLLDAWELDDGRLVADLERSGGALTSGTGAVGSTTAGTPAVLESDDQGATWRIASCPAEAVVSDRTCRQPQVHGELQVRGSSQVSVDGGATWQEMVVEPGPLDGLVVDGVVELRSGGWLATAHVTEDVETIVGYLLRSTDGLVWESVRPPSLPPCDSGGPGTAFTTPVPFRDGWLTAYQCIDVIQPQLSEAFTIDADGSTLTPIPHTRRDGDVAYETAVTVGDDVIIAATREASEDGEGNEDDEQADEPERSLDVIRISP